MNSLAFLISIYCLMLLSGLGFWDQIKRINNVSSKWESYQSWKEWNADENWKFEESSCKSTKVWTTFHTPYLYGKNEAQTSKDYILKHNSNLTEIIFKNGEGSCITKDCEWRVVSVDKMLFEIEIKRDPEINEELTIIAVSNNKVKTFEPKQLSSWTFEPLKLNISNVNYIIIKGSSLNQKSNYEISIQLTSIQEEINVSFKSAWTFAVIFFIIIILLTVILLIGDMWRKRRNCNNLQLIPENLM